jgi:Excreted virulence factor EspC, type VII ESX diderm
MVDDAHMHAPTLMEPNCRRGRHNRMFADTDAIRALGAAHSDHAADLAAVAASLSSIAGTAATSMLGPVGARFVAALAEAALDASHAAAALSGRLATGQLTARASATAYENADQRLGTAVSRL